MPVTGIAEAVFARALSGFGRPAQGHHRAWRRATSAKSQATQRKFIEDVRQALYASKIVAYAQGFNQIQAGSAEYDWDINPGDMATIWRGGCIIRAKFLNRIKEAYDEDPDLPTLLVAPYFRERDRGARSTAGAASWSPPPQLGIPIPGFASALAYYDALRAERLPAALTQGQRDFFGAHTYGRIDADTTRSSTPCGAATAAKSRPSVEPAGRSRNRSRNQRSPPQFRGKTRLVGDAIS